MIAVADPDPVLREQLSGQRVGALAGPAERRLGVTACHRIDELLEGWPHLGAHRLEGALATATPNPDDIAGLGSRTHFIAALAHRADRQLGRPRDRGHAAISHRASLGAGPQTLRALIHGRLQQPPLVAHSSFRVHSQGRSRQARLVDPPAIHFRARLDRHGHSRLLTLCRCRCESPYPDYSPATVSHLTRKHGDRKL